MRTIWKTFVLAEPLARPDALSQEGPWLYAYIIAFRYCSHRQPLELVPTAWLSAF